MKIVALILLLSCSGVQRAGMQWPEIPLGEARYAVVTPIAMPAEQEKWNQRVIDAVAIWNSAMLTAGCNPPFRVGPDGHAMYLIPEELWGSPRLCGFLDGSHILIRESCAYGNNTPIHELGHALGMVHAPDDVNAVMHQNRQTPEKLTEWDIAEMKRATRCK